MGIRITADQHEQPKLIVSQGTSIEITLNPDTSKFPGKLETSITATNNGYLKVFNRSPATVYFNGVKIPPHGSRYASISAKETYQTYAWG